MQNKQIKKVMIITLGLMIIMAQLTGCGKSSKEIEDYFSPCRRIFNTDNLELLYEKSGPTSRLADYSDPGTWIFTTSITRFKNSGFISEDVVLRFNRNTKNATGVFNISEYEEVEGFTSSSKSSYPIYYKNNVLNFIDKNTDEDLLKEVLLYEDEINLQFIDKYKDNDLIKKLSEFKLLTDVVDFNDEYIDKLKVEDSYYLGKNSSYSIRYKLTEEDINIKSIKKMYPSIDVNRDYVTLEFSGSGDNRGILGDVSFDVGEPGKRSYSISAGLGLTDTINPILEID